MYFLVYSQRFTIFIAIFVKKPVTKSVTGFFYIEICSNRTCISAKSNTTLNFSLNAAPCCASINATCCGESLIVLVIFTSSFGSGGRPPLFFGFMVLVLFAPKKTRYPSEQTGSMLFLSERVAISVKHFF